MIYNPFCVKVNRVTSGMYIKLLKHQRVTFYWWYNFFMAKFLFQAKKEHVHLKE